MEQVVLCLNITTSWLYDAATASSKTEGESKFIQEIIKNDYLMIGAIIFTADFNSYGQPYPLLQELKGKGRILVRWSGTEAKLRVMIEGENEASIARQAESLIAAARQDFGERG